jgi:hypothetical protein
MDKNIISIYMHVPCLCFTLLCRCTWTPATVDQRVRQPEKSIDQMRNYLVTCTCTYVRGDRPGKVEQTDGSGTCAYLYV